jgi:outer membrane protein assembly factor BamB
MTTVALSATPAGLARGRAGAALVALLATLAATDPVAARADDRCAGALQDDVCAEAVGSCPVVAPPLGLASGPWPVFQHDVQHTGHGTEPGPTCGNVLWTRKLGGKVLSAPAMGAAAPGGQGTLYVAAAKDPIAALDPGDGHLLWRRTDQAGKLPDASSPALGNGQLLYVGTRDNDLWAITLPAPAASAATVAWREKICTDGDVSTPPIIAPDGVVFMGSNSLAGGTLMAMCPGSARRVKWCVNPLGGTLRNVSPALSPTGADLYVTYLGAFLLAVDAQSGAERWRLQLQQRRNNLRYPNQTPVVDPSTGRIYVGFDTGLFVIDPSQPTPAATMLLPTYALARERIESPPALDVDHGGGRLYVGATRRGKGNTLYALDLAGNVLWRRSDLGSGRLRNTPPVVDAAGRIYLAIGRALYALDPADGHTLWQVATPGRFASSPIVSSGRVYAATRDSTVYAIGDCPGGP